MRPPCSAKTSSALRLLTSWPPPPDRGIKISWLPLVFRTLTGMARSGGSLAAENASKRQNAILPVSPGRTYSPWCNPTLGLLLGERS
jgi:hypothetical protein